MLKKKKNFNNEILKILLNIKIKNKKNTSISNNENWSKITLTNLIFKDMLFYMQIWRQVRGYSKNNQRSHSNNKGNKKFKIINKFRLQQFYKLFGRKRRDIFPTLILAEYNNRLWFLSWRGEWFQGLAFIYKLSKISKNGVKFDPYLLSKNTTTGVFTIKKKKKHNTVKKKIILVATIGVPLFFSRFLYNYSGIKPLPYKLVIADNTRKKMGKKKKKK